jgi:hypothetical protein
MHRVPGHGATNKQAALGQQTKSSPPSLLDFLYTNKTGDTLAAS